MHHRRDSTRTPRFPLSRSAKIAISAGVFVLYAVAFILIFPRARSATGALSTIPLVTSGYLLGVVGGAIVGLINVPLYVGLLAVMRQPGWTEALNQWAGVLVASASAVAAGFLGQLVSRIRLQERQLREARDELEIRVAERTTELRAANERLSRELVDRQRMEAERRSLEAQLIQAQKLESVGILAGGIAHDFNNLLQMISGYSRLVLLEKSESDPDYEWLSVIEVAVERAIQLTRQLLLFSRQEESRLQPLDINAQVKEVIRLLARTIPKMISMETRLAEDLKSVDADAGQIQQVIMNLSVNARDAMPEGGRLLFETRNASFDRDSAKEHPGVLVGDHVHLSVTDTGIGMDEETLLRIYDPFFTTKDIGKGTGLGLAVAYGIIASHHGHISCHSEPGKGTTFDIYLPVGGQPRGKAPAPTPSARAIRGGSEKILVVDDDEHILRWESLVLSKKGYTIVNAPSGEEAVRRYAEAAPALVILDLNMPGMGGFQCLQELLRIDPKVNVIIASGYSGELLPRDLMDQGARAVIPKPFTADILLRKAREVLDKTKERAESAG